MRSFSATGEVALHENLVDFVDNIFNLPPAYAESLCREIAEAHLGITWRCILYPGKVNATLIQAMAEAGCRER